jgi:sirohydrochlorin cobaltochelatase
LFAGSVLAQISDAVAEEPAVVTLPPLADHPALLDLLETQHEGALADRSLLPVSWEEVERQLTAELNTHDKVRPGQAAPDEDEYQQLKAKINAILPPRYQGQLDTVSAAPMAAADLVYDEDGDVAWDQIFGFDDPDSPFCELALAGGPSHRGELLEAVTAEECQKEIGKYAGTVAEIERGIHMITGLPTVKSLTPGWVGVQCDSEEMAIWLVRAIIVENVMVRREGNVLFLPAGPHFTLKDQIKSIVTVTAKTWHYWNEHVAYKKRAAYKERIKAPNGSAKNGSESAIESMS